MSHLEWQEKGTKLRSIVQKTPSCTYYYLAEGSIKAVDHANFCCSCVPLSNISLFKQVVVVETFMLEKPPQYLPVVQLKKL